MADIQIYTKNGCPYCSRAKALLESKGLGFREFDVTRDEALEREMVRRSGRRTVPQIFIDGVPIGGYDDLAALAAGDRLRASGAYPAGSGLATGGNSPDGEVE